MRDIKKVVGDVLEQSELIKAVAQVKDAKGKSVLYGDEVRALTSEEIETLIQNGCYSNDWTKILVINNGFDVFRFHDTCFWGVCVLGKCGELVEVAPGVVLPSGIYNSVLYNCEVGADVLIYNANILSNYIIEDKVILYNVGEMIAREGCAFGNGQELSVAIETGGRETLTYADITIPVAEKVATSRADKEFLKEYAEFVADYVERITSPKGIIKRGAQVKNTKKIEDVFMGESAVIDNATLVKNSTLLSNPEEKTRITDGAYVVNSILQWGCEVTSMAIVDSSVLTEHSHIERHGKVTQSIIGPNTGIAEGEVTASLVGPFVGFHHQALLIAAFWPEGKGNVGYGANIGSNHTGKAPDQEIWCGEGTFFGLGVNIKFPADFSRAPYCIIATGVTALPQKIEFPFSLINTPSASYEGISPEFGEIFPGWVLSDNIFTIRRNEGKFRKRNKARRTQFVFEVFRPDIVDLMIDARKRLSNIKEQKELYTGKDIPGLGKNYMLENRRVKGIETYTRYIRYYALMGLKRRVEALLAEGKKDELAQIYDTVTDDERWEHERKILLAEFEKKDVAEHLRLLSSMQEEIARDVQRSKEKDDKRGKRIIPDYPEAHKPAAEESFVKETWEATRKLQQEIEEILKTF
ncbi:DUF4954 family protein [Candidatus Sumerlaeota bacterium]|nr:DUF4954 family protein [Candidatus Sumerlaeota bacterium]